MGMQVILNKLSPKKVNMAKPIFVIHVPNGLSDEKRAEISQRTTKKLFDWHVLIIASDIRELKVEAFSDKALPPVPDDIAKQLEAVIP